MQSFFYHSLPYALVMLGVFLLCCIFRAVKGPEAADRIIAMNMMTTLVSVSVCILSVFFAEGYLADVALIFSLIGCLGSIILSRIFLTRSFAASEKEDGHVD